MEQRVKYLLTFYESAILFLQKYHNKVIRGGRGVTKIHMDMGRGSEKCPRLSTKGGEGVENRQNIVHVVIEWPPRGMKYADFREGTLKFK